MGAEASPFAWCLNLDAEQELRAAARYEPTRRLAAQMEAQLSRFALLTLGEPIVQRDRVSPEQRVLCWCPTPSALARVAEQGLNPVRGPSLETLRSANHRALGCQFADAILERRFIDQGDPWERILFEQVPQNGWRLKRAFGWAGRGQRCISTSPSQDDVRWVRDSLARGGVLRERELAVHEEYSVHGYVDARVLVVGNPVRFSCDRFGAPQHFEKLTAVNGTLVSELTASAHAVAQALKRADYFGPFGVDAIVWHDSGSLRLNPVSDINARFTLGWSLGLGDARELALRHYLARGSLR